MDSKLLCGYIAFLLSSFIVLNSGLAYKGNVRIRDSVAATICRSLKFYEESKKVAGLLKDQNQFMDGQQKAKNNDGTCRHVKWSECRGNCQKFKYVPCKAEPTEVIPRKESRITGGRYAEPNEFPFIVRINLHPEIIEKLVCGGSIYSKNWVITAAHCISTNMSGVAVVGGDHTRNVSESTEQIATIQQFIVHENYGGALSLGRDIALLKVSPSFSFTKFVQPIPLASESNTESSCEEEEDKEEVSVRVAGWGMQKRPVDIEEYKNLTEYVTLKVADVKQIPLDECKRLLIEVNNVTDERLCTTPKTSELSGPCLGDSGGPLFKTYKNGSWSLIGVVSGGEICGAPTSPAIYTSIAYFRNWIMDHAI